MISSLQLKYNRGRQAVITNELIDIITGASGKHSSLALSRDPCPSMRSGPCLGYGARSRSPVLAIDPGAPCVGLYIVSLASFWELFYRPRFLLSTLALGSLAPRSYSSVRTGMLTLALLLSTIIPSKRIRPARQARGDTLLQGMPSCTLSLACRLSLW